MTSWLKNLWRYLWPVDPPKHVQCAADAQACAATELVETLDRSRSRFRLEIEPDLSRRNNGHGHAD